MHRQEVRRSQSFASSQWFFLQGVSPASLQDFTLGSTLSASSLKPPSWNLDETDLIMVHNLFDMMLNLIS
jgi:hypothetical protein